MGAFEPGALFSNHKNTKTVGQSKEIYAELMAKDAAVTQENPAIGLELEVFETPVDVKKIPMWAGVRTPKNGFVVTYDQDNKPTTNLYMPVDQMALQATAQSIIGRISIPATIQEVPAAEKNLKTLKSEKAALEEKRKETTRKLDSVIEWLSKPERSLQPELTKLEHAIIAVKKQHERDQVLVKAKADELANVAHACTVYVATQDARIKRMIESFISSFYTTALNNAESLESIDFEVLPEDVDPVGLFEISRFTYASLYDQQHAVENVIGENFQPNDQDFYINLTTEKLAAAFSDWDVALINKAEALQGAATRQREAVAEIATEKDNAEMVASLSAGAVYLNTSPGIKELKKSFVIDMPDTMENTLLLLSNFAKYKAECLKYLKVNKWSAFTSAQAATALGKVKTADNSFTGISLIFKEVEKL